jgi:outer membrane receptor for ferric coprogen and ferric-rhodotorulic acid
MRAGLNPVELSMRKWTVRTLAGAVAVSLVAPGATLAQDSADDANLEYVLVTAKRDDRVSRGATGLDLDIAETPQSISIISHEQMTSFATSDINDALRLATGVSVEAWETNRTNYMARGFDIKNTQLDGIGMPNDWGIVTGDVDSYQYEKIEVIRGANGLLTGVGNSSGTLNFVRKRPTNSRQGEFSFSGGSENLVRVEGDYSTPLGDAGNWAARVTGAYEDADSYLRDLRNSRHFVALAVDGQLGERSTLTLGYTSQRTQTDGNMWGALVLDYTDGTQAEFPRDASPAQDWSAWNTSFESAFAEYTAELGEAWELKASYNYRDMGDDSKLFYVYSLGGLEPDNTGLLGWPGRYDTVFESSLVDVNLTGRFAAFGQEHEATFGVSYSDGRTRLTNWEIPADAPAWGALPAFPYAGDTFPEPVWGDEQFYSVLNQEIKRAYGATRVNFGDRWHAVLGFNWTEYHRDGVQADGPPTDQTEREISPYAGVMFDVAKNAMIYASYSDIYQPQDQYDIDGAYLDPSKGVNFEIGVKAGWFENRLLTTLALFSAEQEYLSTLGGVDENLQYWYRGIDVKSEGVELEVSGRVNEWFGVNGGFTSLSLDGEEADVYPWVPRRTANLWMTGKLPAFSALEFGLGGRWQSDVHNADTASTGPVRQDGYAVLNAFVKWEVGETLWIRLNADNLTDEKYITSLYNVGYYSAPAQYKLAMGFTF